MKYLLLTITTLLALNSCGGHGHVTCWRGGIPLRKNELISLKNATPEILAAKNVSIYHGLAHPKKDPAIYAAQLKNDPHVFIKSFAFHTPAENASPELVRNVLELYTNPNSHQALAAPKTTCAGFHPDYVLTWNDEGSHVLQICYGCHEWKYFGPNGLIYTDINEPAYFDKITKWLPAKP